MNFHSALVTTVWIKVGRSNGCGHRKDEHRCWEDSMDDRDIQGKNCLMAFSEDLLCVIALYSE